MRHKFICGRSTFHRGPHHVSEPYTTSGSLHLKYKRPSMTRVYCKIVQWIADHPNCSRKAAICGVFFGKRKRKMYEERLTLPASAGSYLAKVQADIRKRLKMWDNGDFSWVDYNPSRYFAELLWADMIDYDTKTFKYNITENGLELLKAAYFNDNVKKITGKFPWQKSSNV